IYTHKCTHAHTHTLTETRMRTYTRTQTHAHTHTVLPLHTSIPGYQIRFFSVPLNSHDFTGSYRFLKQVMDDEVHMCVCVCMCVCLCVCVSVCVCERGHSAANYISLVNGAISPSAVDKMSFPISLALRGLSAGG